MTATGAFSPAGVVLLQGEDAAGQLSTSIAEVVGEGLGGRDVVLEKVEGGHLPVHAVEVVEVLRGQDLAGGEGVLGRGVDVLKLLDLGLDVADLCVHAAEGLEHCVSFLRSLSVKVVEVLSHRLLPVSVRGYGVLELVDGVLDDGYLEVDGLTGPDALQIGLLCSSKK